MPPVTSSGQTANISITRVYILSHASVNHEIGFRRRNVQTRFQKHTYDAQHILERDVNIKPSVPEELLE